MSEGRDVASPFEYVVPRSRVRRRARRARALGGWALVIALVTLTVETLLPTAFVIETPGPVFNTLGSVPAEDGTEQELISVGGAETYPTEGELDLLTVSVVGNRERTPSWFELALAWFDRKKAVVPIDAIFPEGVTSEQRTEQNAAMMVDSQQEATAAALTALDYDIPATLTVLEVIPDSASVDILEAGDVIVSANGTPIKGNDLLRKIINDGSGDAVSIGILRDDQEQTVQIKPKLVTTDGVESWVIGVSLINEYSFPIDVDIQLNDVGGPSAGMMFALGIMDTLTPGFLNGGADVAGTGTITADGVVGPIGGIRQKLWGAVDAGAEWFLAPKDNCSDVVGHVPDGLEVFAVQTLDDAVAVLDAIREDGDLDALPRCS